MGLDGDTFLNEIASDYLLARLRRGQVGEYLRGVADFVRTRHELPPHRIRSTVRQWLGTAESAADNPPAWLAPEAAARFEVARRWASRPAARSRAVDGWPLRVRATSVLASPIWPAMFDHHDAEHLGVLVEARFPLADLRLVEYLMNIPAVPWCVDKYVARRALADRLPREVLTRPKSPLAGDTVRARIERGDRLPWTGALRLHPQLSRLVDPHALADCRRLEAAEIVASGVTRALMLNEWLWYHLPRS
jgi:asparagine synthase (glutamine-hydrolysing)